MCPSDKRRPVRQLLAPVATPSKSSAKTSMGCGASKNVEGPACIPSWNKMVKRGFDPAQLQVCYDKQKELGNGGRWAPDWKEENWVELGQDCGIGKHLLATPLMWCCCRPSDNALVSIQNN
jgi:hypothetical protein